MDKRTKREVDYWGRTLKPLIGAKVVFAQGCDEHGEVWPALEVEMPNGKRLQVVASRDAEGNGPGHLFVDEVSQGEKG